MRRRSTRELAPPGACRVRYRHHERREVLLREAPSEHLLDLAARPVRRRGQELGRIGRGHMPGQLAHAGEVHTSVGQVLQHGGEAASEPDRPPMLVGRVLGQVQLVNAIPVQGAVAERAIGLTSGDHREVGHDERRLGVAPAHQRGGGVEEAGVGQAGQVLNVCERHRDLRVRGRVPGARASLSHPFRATLFARASPIGVLDEKFPVRGLPSRVSASTSRWRAIEWGARRCGNWARSSVSTGFSASFRKSDDHRSAERAGGNSPPTPTNRPPS